MKCMRVIMQFILEDAFLINNINPYFPGAVKDLLPVEEDPYMADLPFRVSEKREVGRLGLIQ